MRRMPRFRVADEATQKVIDDSAAVSAKRLRSFLSAGAGAVGELFAEVTKSEHKGVLDDDSPARPAWSNVDKPLWKGSAKIRFHEVLAIGGYSIDDNSLVVSIGGSDTVVTGNLELFDESLIFAPHGVWRKRGLDVMRVEVDQPIQFSGIMTDQAGPRALAVAVRPSRTLVVFRIGMRLNGLDDFIEARMAPI